MVANINNNVPVWKDKQVLVSLGIFVAWYILFLFKIIQFTNIFSAILFLIPYILVFTVMNTLINNNWKFYSTLLAGVITSIILLIVNVYLQLKLYIYLYGNNGEGDGIQFIVMNIIDVIFFLIIACIAIKSLSLNNKK